MGGGACGFRFTAKFSVSERCEEIKCSNRLRITTHVCSPKSTLLMPQKDETLLLQQIKLALKEIDNPDKLGELFLAEDYFLGDRLSDQNRSSKKQRGETLQTLVRRSLAELGERDPSAEKLLRLRHAKKRKSYLEISVELHISKTTLYDREKLAITQFHNELLKQLAPLVHLEPIPVVPHHLIEREAQLAQFSEDLVAEPIPLLSIIGPSGIGKTVFAATVARRAVDSGRAVFWHTFRRGLSDSLASFQFALASFFQKEGHPQAWLHLISQNTQRNKVGPTLSEAQLMQFFRSAFSAYGGKPPLIFLDEVDILGLAGVDPRKSEFDLTASETHHAIYEFIEALASSAPFVLIGQHLSTPLAKLLPLHNLSPEAAQALLNESDIDLTSNDVVAVHALTGGNPRLLHLIASAYADETAVSFRDFVTTIQKHDVVRATSLRIWGKLDSDAREALSLLSLLRYPAPTQALLREYGQNIFDQLWALDLIEEKRRANASEPSASIPPQLSASALFREFLRDQALQAGLIPSEKIKRLHRKAAEIREQYGDYTESAYHWIASGDIETGIGTWLTHAEVEIDSGRGPSALALFPSTLAEQLASSDDRDQLREIRTRLLHLVGRYSDAIQEAQQISDDHMSKIGALREAADSLALIQTANGDEVLNAYQQALALADTHLSLAHYPGLLRSDIGLLYTERGQFEKARYELQKARFEIDFQIGYWHERQREYAQARQCYEQALQTTLGLGYSEGEAKVRAGLGLVLILQGESTLGKQHLDTAYSIYERIGHMSQIIAKRCDLTVGLNLIERYEEAVVAGREALALAERYEYMEAVLAICQNLAEAHIALKDLVQAEHFVQRVLQGKYEHLLPDATRVLGEIRLQQGDLAAAQELITEAVHLSKQRGDLFLLAYARRSLGAVFRKLGDEASASEHFDIAMRIFDEQQLIAEIQRTQKLIDGETAN
jgi:tetratricopeptide (TPR) repeat protein